MFTGIITCIGKYIRNNSQIIIYVDDNFTNGLKNGDSICVNGVCLTVVNYTRNTIEFFVMEETLKVAYLDYNYVNLERSLVYNNSISGHIITGHVNNTGKIISIDKNSDESVILTIQFNKIVKYKDSIAINGTSLTISSVNSNIFTVTLIPYTLNHTTFKYLKVNDIVNIEYGLYEYNLNYMDKAIELSEMAKYTTLPNPWVGCVIVNNNIIIGEGYHRNCGSDHAEKVAIDDAIKKGNYNLIKGSTVYVTLEPCHHYGKTPPCDKLLVEHGVSKVIIGQLDPDIRTNSDGVKYLESNGIIVEFQHQDVVYKSIKTYIHYKKNNLPYCILKVALSLDGYIATKSGDSKWISNEKSRNHVQKLRSKCQAIIVGNKTILKDNPRLNVRINNKSQPLRIILDTYNSITDVNLHINDNLSKTLIFTSEIPDFKLKNVEYQQVDLNNDKLDLLQVMKCIYERGILKCMIEGGSGLYTSFIQMGLAQEIYMYRSNVNLGKGLHWTHYKGNDMVNDNPRWELLKIKQFDNDVLCHYKIPEFSPEIKNLKTTLTDAILAIQQGKPIIIMDSLDRENEGDIVVAAEKITVETMIMMMKYTTGIVCVTMNENRAKKLQLEPMVKNNQDPNKTNFMVSCDYAGSKTGISAVERVETIKRLADCNTLPSDLTRPGHVFPLVGHPNGLLSRQGHTESSIYICELANVTPIAAISELINSNGTVMRYNDCKKFALKYDIPLITIDMLKTTL